MSGLKDKILNSESNLLLYSFAPPKIDTTEERRKEIARIQLARMEGLHIDGVILYDIQDESHRTNEERTFPYVPTISPELYAKDYLHSLQVPKIIYKSIANHTREMFDEWLRNNRELEYAVFVGASSKAQIEETKFTLTDAYNLRQQHHDHIILGGVTIPERHSKKGDEHNRILEKKQNGCRFFVSQCVYNIHDTKNLLSDYYYDSLDNSYELRPIILTLSPCGSMRTLQFMKWLGIEVPQWLYNDLKHSKDILKTSVHVAVNIASEIAEFAHAKQIPIGFNIESVSNRKDEIDAAIELLHETEKILGR